MTRPPRWRLHARWTVAIAFAAAVVYAGIAAFTDARAFFSHLRGFDASVIAPALGLVVLGWALRAARWHWFLRRLDIATTPGTSGLTFLAGFPLGVTPVRAGELVKTYYLWERTGAPITQSLAAAFGERATDLLGLALLATVGLLAWPATGVWPGVLGIGIVVAAIVLVRHARLAGSLIRAVERLPLAGRVGSVLRSGHAGVRSVLDARGVAAGTALGLGTWALETTALALLARGFGLEVSWLQAAFVQAMGSILGAISLLPGGLGAKEGGMIGALVLFGVPVAGAAALAVAFRLSTLWFGVAVGSLAVVALRLSRAPAASDGVGADLFAVAGTRLSAVDIGSAAAFVHDAVAQRRRTHVCVCSVNMVMLARKDEGLRQALDEAGLVVPDGYPLMRLGRRRAGPKVGRVRGTDLVRRLSADGATRGTRFYFYGGGPGVAERMATRLAVDNPGLVVVGAESPPFHALEEEERRAAVERINRAAPDVVWVGLGCPKQERWMVENRPHLEAPVLIAVGAAFDFLAGTKREAPRWLREIGFEWLWRFASEPARLWRRVLVEGPHFMALVARDAWRGERAPRINTLKAPAALEAGRQGGAET